ncbi:MULTISPECIES: hypothetical protein [unclassified Shimia]|uniref:hypothetical protein n=1 Tax=unclassified Shimia TaxID=2630038 RepID=UPI003102B796
MKLYIAGLLALIAAPVSADGYWTYGSWNVSSETTSAGNYLRRTCSARFGGDGEPVVHITVNSDDMGPPYTFPTVYVQEYAPRGYATRLQQGQVVSFEFDNGWDTTAWAYSYFDEEGIPQAYSGLPHPHSQNTLRAMRDSNLMVLAVSGRVFMNVYLDGFTAAYLKAMDECGFTGAGVV